MRGSVSSRRSGGLPEAARIHFVPRSGIVPVIAPPFVSRVVGIDLPVDAPKISCPASAGG